MDFGIPWLGDATIPVADTTTNFRMATVFFATFRKLCHVRRKMSFVGGKVGITFFFGFFVLLYKSFFFQKGNSPMDLFFIRDTKLCSTARTTKSTISKWARVAGATSIESTKFAQQNL